MREDVVKNFKESQEAKTKLLADDRLIDLVEQVAKICVDAYRNGHKVLSCGNGGSASDSMHFVGELVGRYKKERAGIPAISLNANAAVMTAIANDYDYESLYSNQVIALGESGDVLFVISTSGNSGNCVKAVKAAKERGIITVAMTGEGGGKLMDLADYTINVPSDNTPRIQEMHILVIHTICNVIESTLYEEGFFEGR